MADLISAAHRPRLCRSDQQPNLLEYIDTTLNESFSLNLTVTRTIAQGYDQFGNTILDQYLLYLLCQKIDPGRNDPLARELYQLLHQLVAVRGRISKAFFEYAPPLNNRSVYHSFFNTYASFIWNELNVKVLLELGESSHTVPSSRHALASLSRAGCFLLKYRQRDLFSVNTSSNRPHGSPLGLKLTGYFVELIAVYYLSAHYHDFFTASRSIDMIFPSPALHSSSSPNIYQYSKRDEKETFHRFLRALHDNGEVHFDLRQVRTLVPSEAHQFVNKKLENKKFEFMNFIERTVVYQQRNCCRSLKSLCRLTIKMNLKRFPQDIQALPSYPPINSRLQSYLAYSNPFAFQSSA